ncbi:MAG: hypothetical protein IK091_04030 [Spirochaetales bacterium]|nr:hypothetical protein [Spirochaetales bacterium]MBR5098371.1 hypothetical protein [Spirochaetales bacterium]
MLDRYPGSLPLFEIGWNVTPKSNWLVSKPERGPAKRRLLTTAQPKIHTGKCVMTMQQLEVFISFWEDFLQDGVKSFLYPDYITGMDEWIEVRFAEPYSYTQSADGNTYQLTISLEVLP